MSEQQSENLKDIQFKLSARCSSTILSVTVIIPVVFYSCRMSGFILVDLLISSFFLSSGGASAHSHRQPKEARSPALFRPRQNPGQQRSEHRLRARGHEPARWDKKYQTGTAGCVYRCVSHSASACETDPISLWGLWKSYSYCLRRFMMHKPYNNRTTIIFLTLSYCSRVTVV